MKHECKNCIHEKVCRIREFPSIQEILEDGCNKYKDKSLCVELPCRCKDCEFLKITNNNKIYAKCKKTGLKFLPFEIDTREHYCLFAKKIGAE